MKEALLIVILYLLNTVLQTFIEYCNSVNSLSDAHIMIALASPAFYSLDSTVTRFVLECLYDRLQLYDFYCFTLHRT